MKLKLKNLHGKLTAIQRTQLTWPYIASGIPAFVDEEHRRQCWTDNCDNLMAAAAADKPNGWHLYETPDLEERARYLASAKGGLERP
jgi:hypothetical protein